MNKNICSPSCLGTAGITTVYEKGGKKVWTNNYKGVSILFIISKLFENAALKCITEVSKNFVSKG